MFKNLKSLFIEEIEENKGKTASGEKGSKTTSESPVSRATVSESEEGDPGQVTQQFMHILFKSMEANNLEGFDYLEYKQSLKSLKKMPMDEPTRFQSAFAMAQTMGASPEQLIQTATHYVDVLQQEEKKFEEALSHQRAKQIGSKEEHIKKLEESIRAKADQIKKLTQEIETDQKKSDQLRREILEASQKVESTKNNFIASYNALVENINSDIEKMKKYLK